MATHSSILAWEIPWTEEPGGLQPATEHTLTHTHASCPGWLLSHSGFWWLTSHLAHLPSSSDFSTLLHPLSRSQPDYVIFWGYMFHLWYPKCDLSALWTSVLPVFCPHSLPRPWSWLLFHPSLSSPSTCCPSLVSPGRTVSLSFGDDWRNDIITCHSVKHLQMGHGFCSVVPLCFLGLLALSFAAVTILDFPCLSQTPDCLLLVGPLNRVSWSGELAAFQLSYAQLWECPSLVLCSVKWGKDPLYPQADLHPIVGPHFLPPAQGWFLTIGSPFCFLGELHLIRGPHPLSCTILYLSQAHFSLQP